MIMSGNEAWNRNALNADGRGRYHVVRQAVADGGSGDWEGPAADGRQFPHAGAAVTEKAESPSSG